MNSHIFLQDFEHLGRAYCETLMDYYDDNPVKVNRFLKLIEKIRKKERKMKRALKAAKKNQCTTLSTDIIKPKIDELPQLSLETVESL